MVERFDEPDVRGGAQGSTSWFNTVKCSGCPDGGRMAAMILTVLEARVESSHHAALQAAYRDAARDPFPPGLVRSVLLRAANDQTLWRIETLWESRAALDAMRGAGTPRGVLIFRDAGADPALAVFEVVDVLSPEGG
jgi:antibiotic biosynthesis monooxygenase